MSRYASASGKCQHCGKPVTWKERRWAFGRLLEGGYSGQDAVAFMPGCYKCAAAVLAGFVNEQRRKKGGRKRR